MPLRASQSNFNCNMMNKCSVVLLVLCCSPFWVAAFRARDSKLKCEPSLTTISGQHGTIAPGTQLCAGDLIFEDNFDFLDFDAWEHEITMASGSNWEFQLLSNNRSNSFTEQGLLNIRPTLTSNDFGETFLTTGTLSLHGGSPADSCTNHQFWGCERTGSPFNIINPVKSARIRTANSFAFKYGKVEINAKMPTGDWIGSSIYFMPKSNAYGNWPASGEMALVESRGNLNLVQNSINIGVEQIGSKLHFGPYSSLNGVKSSTFTRNTAPGSGYNKDFHRYQLEWSPERITFSIDDVETGTVAVGEGFWTRGNFNTSAPGIENPWRSATPIAPFDQEFYCVINLSVGGVKQFPDNTTNPGGKPWTNNSPRSAMEFWNGRNQWLPTWNVPESGYSTALQIDYVRIWAL